MQYLRQNQYGRSRIQGDQHKAHDPHAKRRLQHDFRIEFTQHLTLKVKEHHFSKNAQGPKEANLPFVVSEANQVQGEKYIQGGMSKDHKKPRDQKPTDIGIN